MNSAELPSGENIVVIGGGMVGDETAVVLAESGKDVTLVEMKEDIATDLNPISQGHLVETLEKAGVRMLTNHLLQEIKANNAVGFAILTAYIVFRCLSGDISVACFSVCLVLSFPLTCYAVHLITGLW